MILAAGFWAVALLLSVFAGIAWLAFVHLVDWLCASKIGARSQLGQWWIGVKAGCRVPRARVRR